MTKKILFYVICFFVFSFVGWIIDSAYRTILLERLEFGGLFVSLLWPIPLAPIYGWGAILLVSMIDVLYRVNAFLRMFLIVLSLTLLEYVGGIFLYTLLDRKVWDYSDSLLNFQGFIDWEHSLYWLVLGLLFVHFIYPLISKYKVKQI